MGHAIGCTVGGAGDDRAAVAVADEDGVAQILVAQYGHDVVDVTVEVDIGSEQVGPLAQSRQRRRVNLVPVVSKNAGQRLKAPTAVGAAVYQNEVRHQGPTISITP